MAQFKNLTELQRYLEQNTMEILANSMDVERILANTMSQAVIDVVYTHYEPEVYERRMDDEGLSDIRNMSVVDWGITNKSAYLIFENLTEGNDSQAGKYITDMIENGIENMWNKTGVWSEPRPFVEETIRRLKENPQELVEAIKNEFRARGMKFSK